MSKFDDSLDGSITKPTTNPLLIELQRPAGKITAQQRMINIGLDTEHKILEILKKEGEVFAFMISKKYDMPDRTVGGAILRLERKGIVESTYQMRKSVDGKKRQHKITTLVKTDAIKGRKGKRNSKKV